VAENILKRVPPVWRERFEFLGRAAEKRNLPLCLVGGCVRDLLLKRAPLDWDVVVQGPAAGLVQDALARFGGRMTHHPAFLTYTLAFPDGSSLDVATARQETYVQPAALPLVEPAALSDDFSRRDFTVNALAAHVTPRRWGEIEDPFGGRADLRAGKVRVLHDKSFVDDPTRLYRAARYAGRYGWSLEPATKRLAAEAVARGGPAALTPARLRTELEKVLQERDAAPAMALLWKQGLWTFWSGSWQWTPFVKRALSAAAFKGEAAEERLLFRLLALCRREAPADARADLSRLEFPRAVSDTAALALRLLRHFESEKTAPDATRLPAAAAAFLRRALPRPGAVDRWEAATPALAGGDLQKLGYPPGPEYQRIFQSLRQARWEGKLKSRADEIRFVIDNFPRKQ
jgi:tRNA nucleotidyltransferase (CCA-adding enzyme)